MIHWSRSNDAIGAANRGSPCESTLCTLCRADCQGRCETWLSSLKGRKILYPRDFGTVTAGSANTTHLGVSYNSLRIQGYLYGASDLPPGLSTSPDDCVFPNVSIETSFGSRVRTPCRLPLMTGALGSTFIAAKYWESLAAGAALVGFPIVVGENVVGVDRAAVLENGGIREAPELDRRISTYLRYHDRYGAVIVQMNVEDTRNGVAEYLIDRYGEDVVIELKWGQGAKVIGGEIQVESLDYATFLRDRGYIVDPDPTRREVTEAFRRGNLRSIARHSRLGYTDRSSPAAVHDAFMASVAHLRALGFQRISLKTGSYGMEALAMAIRFAAEAELDLLTIDGSGGGTGMSPWNMMESWGVPSILLHAKAYEYAAAVERTGLRPADMAFAGGLAKEDQIFKALALGAPYAKLVCMGRALMIPGYVGSNIEGVLKPGNREGVHGNWSKLPRAVEEMGTTPEEIFAGYFEVEKKVGKKEMERIPFGAIAVWTLADKLGAGLQQLLAGVRKFRIQSLSRDDIFSANRETERETGIPFCTDVGDEAARDILAGNFAARRAR